MLGTHSYNEPFPDPEGKFPVDARTGTGVRDSVEPLLNIDEAARIIGRAHWTLRRDIRGGKLECVRIGRRIMIEPSEIRRLIGEGRKKHGSC
jgi:hypothetical protein